MTRRGARVRLAQAFMAVHDGCAEPKESAFFSLGKQAPMATVRRYGTTVLDTYKVAGPSGRGPLVS